MPCGIPYFRHNSAALNALATLASQECACCAPPLIVDQVVMVGDGITDLEAVQESGGADMFVGFGGE